MVRNAVDDVVIVELELGRGPGEVCRELGIYTAESDIREREDRMGWDVGVKGYVGEG